MDEFLTKWKSDTKYRAKIKLSFYAIFVVLASIYAISLSHSNPNINKSEYSSNKNNISNINDESAIISLPNNYSYTVDINIDDELYEYFIKKVTDGEEITKKHDAIITNYIFKNNNYYKQEEISIKTNKNEVYDVIDYNYINIDSINTYLKDATKNGNEYLVYIKDIVLDNTSEEYFVILVNDNHISIDYTPLMKIVNPTITKCRVDIRIDN